MSESPFKAYDIRGRVGDNLDEDMAYRLGRAVVDRMAPGRVATGRDIRESSAGLQAALMAGLADGGADVTDIGLCGTEEVYFATDHLGAGAGIMVTASHNPIDYNGMKLVGPGARPLSNDAFRDLEAHTQNTDFAQTTAKGQITTQDTRPAYVAHVTGLVDAKTLPEVSLVANPGNGCAGPCFDAIHDALTDQGAKITVTRLHHDPDGSFPNGIPNPLIEANQPVTSDAVRAAGADLGLAWDGDYDRCFFFDDTGAFVPGEYMVGVIARAMLAREPGAAIVHDPRVQWNTQALVAAEGGQAVRSKTGHALVKAAMREADAIYGGEMSAHHYFRDFMFCDSGMIPWLMVLAAMGQAGTGLGPMVADMRTAYPSSGEINYRVEDPARLIAAIEAEHRDAAVTMDRFDGLSMEFADWRFNLRMSSTEPLLRLNVETRGTADLLAEKLEALKARIARG